MKRVYQPSAAKQVPLSQIRVDLTLQIASRGINEEHAEGIAEAFRAGLPVPPVELRHDGEVYWLARGFHRHRGAVLAGAETIAAIVKPGGRREAWLDSRGGNRENGRRRTLEELHEAIDSVLADPECAAWSSVRIAVLVETTDKTVENRRRGSELPNLPRIGIDGKSYPATPPGRRHSRSRRRRQGQQESPWDVAEYSCFTPSEYRNHWNGISEPSRPEWADLKETLLMQAAEDLAVGASLSIAIEGLDEEQVEQAFERIASTSGIIVERLRSMLGAFRRATDDERVEAAATLESWRDTADAA